MGLLGSIDDFFVGQGQQAGSFLKGALSQAGDFACQLHYNTPGVIFDLNPINRGLWQELCAKRPSGLPPVPTPDFAGGQCLNVAYRVSATFLVKFSTGNNFYATDAAYVWGPITSISYTTRQLPDEPDNTKNGVIFVIGCRGGSESSIQPQGTYEFIVRKQGTLFAGVDRVSDWTVARMDGQQDNCGNPPPPVVEPVILPPEERTTNIDVTNLDNSVTNINVILGFPSAFVDFNLSVPLTVNLGGVNFYLNIDGWHSGLPGDFSSDLEPIRDIVKPVQDGILHLNGTLNQYFAPVNPSVNPSLTLIAPSFGKDSDEQKDISGAQWIIIDLTKMPDKAQYGGDSPTVYFAGWIEFLKEGRAFPRQQINFEQSIFRFPDGADGYAYTFTNGAQGNVSVYVQENR